MLSHRFFNLSEMLVHQHCILQHFSTLLSTIILMNNFPTIEAGTLLPSSNTARRFDPGLMKNERLQCREAAAYYSWNRQYGWLR